MRELDIIVEEACKHSHEYLEKNFPNDWVRDFKIGYLPKNSMRELISRHGLDKDVLKKQGVLYDHDFCPFEGRVIIPIYDGKFLVGIAGRYADKNIPDKTSKYVNTIFEKDKFFFTKPNQMAKRTDRFIAVEGYTDVMALSAIDGVVPAGLMGTSLSIGRAERLKKLPIPKYLFLDGDKAGRIAIINAYEKIKGVFDGVYDCDGFDPDEFIDMLGELPATLSLEEFCLKYYRMYFSDEKFVSFLLQNRLTELYKQTIMQ